MINQKKAKKLRKLLRVKAHGDRTYMTADGGHHTLPAHAKSHRSLGGLRSTRVRLSGIHAYQGSVTLSKHEPRNGYQRIKRSRIANQILDARAV